MGQTPWVESLRSPNSSNITSLRTMNASPSPPSNGGTCVGLALVDGRNGQLTSWCGLLQALETRFATSTYEDPTITLFKLMQHGSVNDYLSEFETLANRIIGFQLTSWNVVGFFFFFFFLAGVLCADILLLLSTWPYHILINHEVLPSRIRDG